MFSPIIAKKITSLLNSGVEADLNLIFDDLISQRTAKIKGNAPDLELRVAAVEIDLLNRLKNYKNHLENAVKQYGN